MSGQANFSYEHGGHDMQPLTNDRYMLHLAAWLDSMDMDRGDTGFDSQAKLCSITPETVTEHPLLAPRLEKLYEKWRASTSNPSLRLSLGDRPGGVSIPRRQSSVRFCKRISSCGAPGRGSRVASVGEAALVSCGVWRSLHEAGVRDGSRPVGRCLRDQGGALAERQAAGQRTHPSPHGRAVAGESWNSETYHRHWNSDGARKL